MSTPGYSCRFYDFFLWSRTDNMREHSSLLIFSNLAVPYEIQGWVPVFLQMSRQSEYWSLISARRLAAVLQPEVYGLSPISIIPAPLPMPHWSLFQPWALFFHIVFITAINHQLHFLTFWHVQAKQRGNSFLFFPPALYPLVVISLHSHFK